MGPKFFPQKKYFIHFCYSNKILRNQNMVKLKFVTFTQTFHDMHVSSLRPFSTVFTLPINMHACTLSTQFSRGSFYPFSQRPSSVLRWGKKIPHTHNPTTTAAVPSHFRPFRLLNPTLAEASRWKQATQHDLSGATQQAMDATL